MGSEGGRSRLGGGQATEASPAPAPGEEVGSNGPAGFLDILVLLVSRWKLLLFWPLLVGSAALGVTFVVPPTFTARTVFLPPQQQQSLASSALASLGALSSLAGAAAGIRSPIDQYVTLLQSATVADRIVDQFDLMHVYDSKYRVDARKDLAKNLRVTSGRRDGLITLEVDDRSAQRAADMANRYVEELRRLTSVLALTEAQQRRAFFEQQLGQSKTKLSQAQEQLQGSGFSPGALKAEPRTAAEGYARLRAEVTYGEVRLQALRRNLADGAPEVQQQGAVVAELRAQLARLEAASDTSNDPGYVGKYREFKYQEALFELLSRQYEVARLDESREAALIQVVDVALPAERRTRPKRALTAVLTTLATFAAMVTFIVVRRLSRTADAGSPKAGAWARLSAALKGH